MCFVLGVCFCYELVFRQSLMVISITGSGLRTTRNHALYVREQETVFYELLKERMEDKVLNACYCYF